MTVTVNSIKDAPRISSSELARRPGQLMEEVLRRNVIIVQNRGRDIAALVDIEEYRRLLDLIDQLANKP
jgi:prevent-host-death family protein